MDQRKLIGNTRRGDELVTFNWEGQENGPHHEHTKYALPKGFEPLELLKRYNAYPDLLEMVRRMFNIATHPKSKLADIRMIANEARGVLAGIAPAEKGPKPFTVVAGNGIAQSTSYVLASSMDEAASAGIEEALAKNYPKTMSNEHATIDQDHLRKSFKCLAIYAGHIENLLKS